MVYFVFCAHLKSSALGLCPVKYSIIFSNDGQNLNGVKEEKIVNTNGIVHNDDNDDDNNKRRGEYMKYILSDIFFS